MLPVDTTPDPGEPEALRVAADHLETLADWLGARDVDELTLPGLAAHGHPRADLLVLFGATLPAGWDLAARAVLDGAVERLLVVGGVGHSTDALWDLLEAGGRTGVRGRPEADLVAEHLAREHGLTGVLVERGSTNCGANVAAALHEVRRAGLQPATVVLVQDPSMQRRVRAVVDHTWDLGATTVLDFAAYRPRLVVRAGALAFADPLPGGDWPVQRWISLLLGEVPRLSDTPDGYGPRGRGFLAHVDVPHDVRLAHAALVATPGWRERAPDDRFAH